MTNQNNTKPPPFIKTDRGITVTVDGHPHMVVAGSKEYELVKKALIEKRYDDIPGIISVASQINEYTDGAFTVLGGELKVGGKAVPARLASKILQFKDEGLPYGGLIKFASKLLLNPSRRAVQQLFDFLEVNLHPITDDGDFIAYKSVRTDFLDKYSGKFDNSPGKTVEMERNEVDEDPNRTCSNGLHVANWNYAATIYGSASDTMIEVLVNPRDVVAVPIDYNNSKMRTCRYVVIGKVEGERKTLYSSMNPEPSNLSEEPDYDNAELEEEDCEECGEEEGCHHESCPYFEEEEEEEEEEECNECGWHNGNHSASCSLHEKNYVIPAAPIYPPQGSLPLPHHGHVHGPAPEHHNPPVVTHGPDMSGHPVNQQCSECTALAGTHYRTCSKYDAWHERLGISRPYTGTPYPPAAPLPPLTPKPAPVGRCPECGWFDAHHHNCSKN